MSLHTLPGVIFDLGGVLLRWDPAAIIAAVFADPPVRNAVRKAVFEHPDWLELDRGTLSRELALERFAARSGQSPGAIRKLLDYVPQALAPQQESVDLLLELNAAGVALYGLSNMHAANIAYLTRTHEFFQHFRDIVFSCCVKMIKPEPAIYAYAAARFGLQPSSCVFVDDAPPNVHSARQAGWHAIRFCDAAQCRRELNTLAANFTPRNQRKVPHV